MCYYVIADLDVGKYEIYHIRDDEDFYDEFIGYMINKTKHNIQGQIQSNPMRNTSIYGADIKDFAYFESYLQEFRINRMKKSKP